MNPYAAHDRIQAEREVEGDAFVSWCEANDVDCDDDDAWAAFEDASNDAREAAAEDAADARDEGDW